MVPKDENIYQETFNKCVNSYLGYFSNNQKIPDVFFNYCLKQANNSVSKPKSKTNSSSKEKDYIHSGIGMPSNR